VEGLAIISAFITQSISSCDIYRFSDISQQVTGSLSRTLRLACTCDWDATVKTKYRVNSIANTDYVTNAISVYRQTSIVRVRRFSTARSGGTMVFHSLLLRMFMVTFFTFLNICCHVMNLLMHLLRLLHVAPYSITPLARHIMFSKSNSFLLASSRNAYLQYAS